MNTDLIMDDEEIDVSELFENEQIDRMDLLPNSRTGRIDRKRSEIRNEMESLLSAFDDAFQSLYLMERNPLITDTISKEQVKEAVIYLQSAISDFSRFYNKKVEKWLATLLNDKLPEKPGTLKNEKDKFSNYDFSYILRMVDDYSEKAIKERGVSEPVTRWEIAEVVRGTGHILDVATRRKSDLVLLRSRVVAYIGRMVGLLHLMNDNKV